MKVYFGFFVNLLFLERSLEFMYFFGVNLIFFGFFIMYVCLLLGNNFGKDICFYLVFFVVMGIWFFFGVMFKIWLVCILGLLIG